MIKWAGMVVFACLFPLVASSQIPEQINYQGRLVNGTNLVNTGTSMVFRLFNAGAGGTMLYVETQAVTIVDGLYSVQLGTANVAPWSLAMSLTNSPVYLELAIGDVALSPREPVTAAGYALKAADVPGNVFWRTTGNTGTVAGTQFLGTLDNRPLSLRVNNRSYWKLEPATLSPLITAGNENNFISPTADGSVIGGGGQGGVSTAYGKVRCSP